MTKVKDSTTNVARKSASSVGSTMVKVKDSTANVAKKSVASVTNIIPSSRLPIAEVRPDQLQELKTGSERAVAYERKVEAKRFAALKFLIPKSYNPPALPEHSDIPESSGLLPALTPN